jgi:signal transduction histidine kinase
MKVLGTPRTLSPKVQHTFYRTAQESLNNIRKHSRAEHVWILLDYTQSNCIRLQVRDDGVGADHLDGGFGLIGIKERVTYLNGKVSTQTNLGQGFCLDVEIPV